jgi:hypothetical protein
MLITSKDVVKARVHSPYRIEVTLRGHSTSLVDVRSWIESDAINRPLLSGPEFLKGYSSASGGIEWASGPYLSKSFLADLMNEQHGNGSGR